jgi:hypothetical protein
VGFRIRHAWVLSSCPLGSFGPLAPVVPRWGTTGGRCVFHGLSLILGLAFSVELGLRPCSLRIGGSGRWLLSFPSMAGCWLCSESSFSATYSSGRGDLSGEFSPYQGRYSPATRPVTLEGDGNDGGVDRTKMGCLLIGAVQVQVKFGCFVLRLVVSRASFGLLLREGFSSGAPRVSLWLPLGAWAPPAPVGFRGRCPLFPFLT